LSSKNIEINGLVDRVTLYPIAISDKSEFGYLNMSSTDLGGAFNEFSDREIESVGDGAYRRDVLFKQGIFSQSIDRLVEDYGFDIPNYIKIDVDGIEDKIIYGGSKTLINSDVKGLFVELDERDSRTEEIINFLRRRGLKLIDKRHSEMFENSKYVTNTIHIW